MWHGNMVGSSFAVSETNMKQIFNFEGVWIAIFGSFEALITTYIFWLTSTNIV